MAVPGYNWADSVHAPDWMSFTEIFEDFVAWAEPKGLPIVIGETGSFEAVDDPNGKANWLRHRGRSATLIRDHSKRYGYHRLVCRVFPFSVFYRVETPGHVVVVSVFHQRRGEEWIMDRLGETSG